MIAENEGKVGGQQKNTKIIMSVVKRNKDGSYKLNLNNKKFRQLETKYENNVESKGSRGTPKRVFLHNVFHGDAAALKEAIEEGDVIESEVNGRPWCHYAMHEITRSKGHKSEGTFAGSRAVNDKEWFATVRKLEKFGLAFELSGSQQRALENGVAAELPAPMLEAVKKATEVERKNTYIYIYI